MVLKLKFRDDTPLGEAEKAVKMLEDEGVPTSPAFRNPKRPSLARIFRIDVDEARMADVQKVLRPIRSSVEFLEGPVARRPIKSIRTRPLRRNAV